MPVCIYCLEEKSVSDFNVEHVIPKSFGTFGSQTPTLIHSVCIGCNDYFCKELDQVLSRDTHEGITRYPLGMKSVEARPQTKVKLSIPDKDDVGDFAGARVWVNGTTGKLELHNQVGFVDKVSGERKFFIEEELTGLVLEDQGLTDKGIRVLAASQKEHDDLVANLISTGIIKKYEIKETFDGQPLSNPIKPYLESVIDDQVKRALTKIAFNFATKYIGKEEVMKARWDSIRKFTRYGIGSASMRVQSGKPFWDNEKENWRFGGKRQPNAIYNIRLENQDIGIVAMMEFFHLLRYEIVLVHGESLLPEQEIGFAFIPGVEPLKALKFTVTPSILDNTKTHQPGEPRVSNFD